MAKDPVRQFHDRKFPWHWWWTVKTDYREYDPKDHITKILASGKGREKALEWKRIEPLAWALELARRHDRKRNLEKFPDQEEWVWRAFECMFPSNEVILLNNYVPLSQDLRILDDRVWSDIPDLRCNLSASDTELADAFIRLIHEERRSRGVMRDKKKGPHHKRNKPISWRWPEVLDIADLLPTHRLNDSERSILSRARRTAALYASRLDDYLSSYLE